MRLRNLGVAMFAAFTVSGTGGVAAAPAESTSAPPAPAAILNALPAKSVPAPSAMPERTDPKSALDNPEPARPEASTPPVTPPTAETEKAAEAKVVAPPPPPPPSLLVDIDLTRQRMNVTEGGKVKYTWAISSGRQGYETPRGKFRPAWMSKMWYSRKYDDAPMPHAIFFSGGNAIHGTSSVGMLGRPASHGCVRLAPGNAATLFKAVQKHGMAGTRITVHGTPKFSAPALARRQTPDLQRNMHYGYQLRPARPGIRYGQQLPRGYYYVQPGYNYGYAPTVRRGPAYTYYQGYGGQLQYRPTRPNYRPYGSSSWFD